MADDRHTGLMPIGPLRPETAAASHPLPQMVLTCFEIGLPDPG